MKKKILTGLMIGAVLFTCLFSGQVFAETEPKSVDVMFLHDTHSHLNEFATVEGGESQVLGGFAKIKTLINQQKAENPDTLLLDAGDFSMGTLIQVVFEEEASEIRMLGALGFDATTLGNHEFDYKAKGLANMMNNAVASGDVLPAMVLCNVDWDSMREKGFADDQQMLWEAFEHYEDAVIYNGDQELKAWVAIADYMTSFEDTDGDKIPNVPQTYATEEGRKVVEDSKNIIDLVKNPNKFFFIIIGLMLVVVAILVSIIVLIIKLIKMIVKKIRKREKK